MPTQDLLITKILLFINQDLIMEKGNIQLLNGRFLVVLLDITLGIQ